MTHFAESNHRPGGYEGRKDTDMEIIENRRWSTTDVHAMCIRESLYTEGDNEDYRKMLSIVRYSPFPTLDDIYRVADDIYRHTKGQSVANIMAILSNDVVRRHYYIME